MVTGDANDGCPKVDQGCQCAEDLGRGLGADCAAACEPRQSPRQYGKGRRCSPKEVFGLYWEIGSGSGGRRSEGFRAATLRRRRKQHPRPLLPASARICSVRAPAPRRGRRKARGKEPLPGSDATGPGPPAPLPTQSSPPLSSPPPASTQIGPPVP